MAELTVAVFAKAPIIGQVKTRMQTALSAEQALELHCALVQHTLKNAVASEFRVELWCSQPHPWLTEIGEKWGVELKQQQGEDLGQRMAHASSKILAQGAQPVLVGADCPEVTADVLINAKNALAAHDAVMAPASDGGYVLLGLRIPCEALFQNIDWGTAQVAEQTRREAKANSYALAEIETLRDIDRPEDLALVESMNIWRPTL